MNRLHKADLVFSLSTFMHGMLTNIEPLLKGLSYSLACLCTDLYMH